MIIRSLKTLVVLILAAATVALGAANLRSPYQIVEQAPSAEWRAVVPDNASI